MPIKTAVTRYHPDFSYYDNDEVIGQSLELYGEYAEPEIAFLRGFIDDNSVVYDVGANIGVHTRAFADRGARVWAFEPNPANFELLKTNCQDLDRVHLVEAAVGEKTGRTTIWEFDPEVPGNYGHLCSGQGGRVCHEVSLDDIDAPDPDIIKVDVEGRELKVLLGAQERIRRNQPLIYYEAQETADFGEIYHLLTGLGYTLYWALVMNYNPNNFRNNPDNIFDNTAIFCVVAAPPGFAILPLDRVTGAGDSWQSYCDRVNSKQA